MSLLNTIKSKVTILLNNPKVANFYEKFNYALTQSFMFNFMNVIIGVSVRGLLLLTLNKLGIKYCKSNSTSQIKKIRNLITNASQWDNCEPAGYVLGENFVGYIEVDHYANKSRLSIFAKNDFLLTKGFFKEENLLEMTKRNEEIRKIETSPDIISFWMREGGYENFLYNSIKIPVDIKVRDNQIEALDKIIEYDKQNTNSVILLSGEIGTGKSSIPLLLANQLKYDLVDSFNPTDPGDTISKLIRIIDPTYKRKLIIVLEEIDVMINRIHNETTSCHKNIPNSVTNKESWNMFLDKIDRMFYSNIILIMTTNRPIEYFNDLDPSYMRDGRVNLKLTLD